MMTNGWLTIETSGLYHASKALISAGTRVKTLLPGFAYVRPVRKVFAGLRRMGVTALNNFPAFTGEMPNGDPAHYGFPAENDGG